MDTTTLDVQHLFDVQIDLADTEVTFTPRGAQSVHIARGGTFAGDRLSGDVLSGGGDWLLTDQAGIGHIDVRVTLKTTDGAIIHVEHRGRIVFHDDALQRLLGGASLTEDDTYFRVAPTFSTLNGPYGWLNAVQAVGIGHLLPGQVRYRMYELL